MGNGASYITLAEAAPHFGEEVVQLIGKQQNSAISSDALQSAVFAGTTAAALLIQKRHEVYHKLFSDLPLYILTEHRSSVVTVFGLPASLLWNSLMNARSRYIHTFYSAPHLHDQRVAAIQEQVKNRPDPYAPICTSRPGWQSISPSYRTYKKKWNAIDMPLHDILSMDTSDEGMIVHVEPFVSIGQLTHALNPKGFTLPVVPEMDDLTVGGLIMGTGIESSSHKYGLFHEIIVELELLLGDGTVVVATADNEYSDLFRAVPWSYGTLGLLLSAKLKIIPCKNYVKLTYTPHHSKDGYVEHMRQLSGEYDTKKITNGNINTNGHHSKNGHDSKSTPMFVEALAYSLETGVVMSGEFVDAKDVPFGKANRIGFWHKPWFYKHVEQMLWKKTGSIWSRLFGLNGKANEKEPSYEPVVEYIPLRDYYHRHTQSLFWEMEMLIPIGNHFLFRWLFGWLMPPKVSFIKLFQTEMLRDLMERTHMAQDFLVPTRQWSSFMEVCDKEFDKIYPVWLCLHDHAPMPGSLLKDPAQPDPNRSNHEMYVDVGIYGLPRCVHEKREDEFDMKKAMRNVLQACVDMDGFQMLYADVFSTRTEFEQMFDHKKYRKLRSKYNADTGAFKEVYDKMSVVV
ncbi:unnamed protein product [Cylindrotheca closterium]|uniref:Delta(24)-sterol reductase n=1 Tax=Cylindrotheca closterium TaxID=2856 RepID=A0AAD2GD03_9STRA|nr:unnamed protein product [Cylindrotheca closterium]